MKIISRRYDQQHNIIYRFVQSPVSPHYHPCRSTLHALVAAFMPSDTIALPAACSIPQQSLHTCNNRANSFLYNNSSKKTVVFSSNPLSSFFLDRYFRPKLCRCSVLLAANNL